MDTPKHFIVVRKLDTSKNQLGDIVSNEYSLTEIKSSLGDNVSIVKDEIQVNGSDIYLVLTCKNIIKKDKPKRTTPIVETFPIRH